MTLSKKTKTDRIETVSVLNHFVLQCRNRFSVYEGDQELSAKFERYTLTPDADVSAITDSVVLAQFNAIMTDKIKQNYQKFLESQNQPEETEE